MDMQAIDAAAKLLRASRSMVALTGAGFSRPSGIPDFRSSGGLWERHNPAEVASLHSFHHTPRRFYDWFRPLVRTIEVAIPNAAHYALAQLEQERKLRALITQNIDGLHQRAGSREVYELHGHLRTARCTECEREVPTAGVMKAIDRGQIPACSCGGVFKPDVVLFDEMLPRGLYWLAQRALDHADLMLVAGTSLEVAPVCDMPGHVKRRGAPLIVINLDETHADEHADVVIRADVAKALPLIVERAK